MFKDRKTHIVKLLVLFKLIYSNAIQFTTSTRLSVELEKLILKFIRRKGLRKA